MQTNDIPNMPNWNETEIVELKVELRDAHARWMEALSRPTQNYAEIMEYFDKKNELELRIIELGGTLP